MPITFNPQRGARAFPQPVGGGPSRYIFTATSDVAIAGAADRFLFPGHSGTGSTAEAPVTGSVPVDGTFKRIEARINTNTTTANSTITLRVAGADTTLLVTFTAGQTGNQRLATDVSATQGQTVDFEVTVATDLLGLA